MSDPQKPFPMKHYLLLATFAIVLYCLLNHLGSVMNFLHAVFMVLKPVFIALIIAFLFNLLMVPYERILFPKAKHPKARSLRRVLSILMAIGTVVLVIFLLIEFLLPQLSDSLNILLASLPGWANNLNNWVNKLAQEYEFIAGVLQPISPDWELIINNIGNLIKDYLPGVLSQTINFTSAIINFVLGLALAIYALFNKEKYISELKKLVYAFADRHRADQIVKLGHMANQSFSRFISGQIIEACILGTLCTIGMTLFGFPYPVLIGVMIGITGIIPILGAYLGAIPAVLIIMMIDPIQALWWVLFIIVLQQIEGNFIYPRVVGSSIGLDGFWVLFALLVGGSIAGVGGILIGIPTFALIYSLLFIIANHRLEKRGLQVKTEGLAVPIAELSTEAEEE